MNAPLLLLLLAGTSEPCPRTRLVLSVDERGVHAGSTKQTWGSCLSQHRAAAGPWLLELRDAKGKVYWADEVPAATQKHVAPRDGQPAAQATLPRADLLVTVPGPGGHLCLRAPPATLPAAYADKPMDERGRIEVGCVDVGR
jgi:hypothetical protein